MDLNYKEGFDEAYSMMVQTNENIADMSKLHFVAMFIFDFELDDTEMYESFALRMIEVIESILNEKTYEYIKSNYENYLLMVNMPFLKDKIDYGVSIRGAWFDEYEVYECCGIPIPQNFLSKFMTSIVEWVHD